jgi:hypothetical protein
MGWKYRKPWHIVNAGLYAPVITKRLVCCIKLAYHRLVKLLDRNTGASGVHARDDPDTGDVCACAVQTAVDALFPQEVSAGTSLSPIMEKGR